MKLSSIKHFLLLAASVCFIRNDNSFAQPAAKHNLRFDAIPTQWDKGIPLGNGMIGVLVWQQGDKLRLAIDRADLWDLRPTAEIHKYTYQWAYQQRLSGDWDTVWKVADEPYDRDPAPTKIPGAALEFNISSLGPVTLIELDIASAICTIRFKNGVQFFTCVDATAPVGYYQWTGADIQPELLLPPYVTKTENSEENQVVSGADLQRLGYKQGIAKRKDRLITAFQQCYPPLAYRAAVISKYEGETSFGAFSITSHYGDRPKTPKAGQIVKSAIRKPFQEAVAAHRQWWLNFWQHSSITVPDDILEKQWYLEMYKLGSASRPAAPPISLQAVWTADNGKLPPWKGDFHNDLNTQLSYWPAYSSNHLEEASAFTDWLWENKPVFEKYARDVFGAAGLNVPGVATLRGKPMGGWHMYAMSPTVGCWLAQHFYLQWKYSADQEFLLQKAYPWVSEAARFIEEITVIKNGERVLPMSSSPEFHDGNMEAWFLEMTNYDRALCRYIFRIAAEMAESADNEKEAAHWKKLGSEIPELILDEEEGLMIAPGFPYKDSHRHFSHLMAIHPLGLLDFSNEKDRAVMEKSVANLLKQGPAYWCGYSYSWRANIHARLKQGNQAAEALSIFARCFCSPNSFHLNGDQCKAGYSTFTYDPFTLEGNFAFASGLQEILLQSHSGVIEVFPAIPDEWKNVSFVDLRAEGAFLVSAVMKEGIVESVLIKSLKGGTARIKLPFPTFYFSSSEKMTPNKPFGKELVLTFEAGGFAEIKNGFE